MKMKKIARTRLAPSLLLLLTLALATASAPPPPLDALRDWFSPWLTNARTRLRIREALRAGQFVHISSALRQSRAASLADELADPSSWARRPASQVHKTPSPFSAAGPATCDSVLKRMGRRRRKLAQLQEGAADGSGASYIAGSAPESIQTVAWKYQGNGGPSVRTFRELLADPRVVAYFADEFLLDPSDASSHNRSTSAGDLTIRVRPMRLGLGDYVVPHADTTGFQCHRKATSLSSSRSGSRGSSSTATTSAPASLSPPASGGPTCRQLHLRKAAIIFHFCRGEEGGEKGGGGREGGDLIWCHPHHRIRCNFNTLTIFSNAMDSDDHAYRYAAAAAAAIGGDGGGGGGVGDEQRGDEGLRGFHMVEPVNTPSFERLSISGWIEEASFDRAVARLVAAPMANDIEEERRQARTRKARPAGLYVDGGGTGGAGGGVGCNEHDHDYSLVLPTFDDDVLQLMPLGRSSKKMK